jgi:SAM-dependent methyltransferase
MKLSQLIDFRNRLINMPVKQAQLSANQELDHIRFHVQSIISELPTDLQEKLTTTSVGIDQAFDTYNNSIENLKSYVQEKITEEEKYWFQESYKLFEQVMFAESNEQILNRRLSKTGENSKVASFQSETILKGRLSSYADWRFAGLVIRPGLENFVESMVGYDPLYIVDQNRELLKPCLDQFPKLYQNRLRPYTLNDRNDQPILSQIPNNQFGLCLVYNFLNYRPLEIIRRYLEEIYQKLRPGGILLMTYNDCDQANAVRLVENNYACYTPGYLIRDLAKNVGYDQTHTWGDGGPSVWLELRKPGKLESLRGGQTLATIKDPIEIQDDVDFLARKVYTIDEVEKTRAEIRKYSNDESKIMSLKPMYLAEFLSSLQLKYRREQEKLIAEENARTNEEERQRVVALHKIARSYGIDPLTCQDPDDVQRYINEAVDRKNKRELVLLRQRAIELNVGDVNLIKYGYSAEKLKLLIKEKEEEQK